MARECAMGYLVDNQEVDEARHVLFLTAFVIGDYEGALAYYDAIDKSYAGLDELDEPVLEAYLHLIRTLDALRFAQSRKATPNWMVKALKRHIAQPFKTSLSALSVVPFADHALREYFPAFSCAINGQRTTAHLDTGGGFLYMGSDRAKALGIETFRGGKGSVHLSSRVVPFSTGIVERFELGDAVLQNVPINVIPTLTGQQDFIIFGTRILQPFLPTVDYPNQQLILSPRGDNEEEIKHFNMLPATGVRMPFYLWGEHYMFVRGNLGPFHDLSFFVDSGLVSLHPDDDGYVRQAAFTTSKKKFRAWGISRKEMSKGFFASPYALGLGSLQQDDHLLVVGQAGDADFGGVAIDGLISHCFLAQYAWTIDFDRREYVFRMPVN